MVAGRGGHARGGPVRCPTRPAPTPAAPHAFLPDSLTCGPGLSGPSSPNGLPIPTEPPLRDVATGGCGITIPHKTRDVVRPLLVIPLEPSRNQKRREQSEKEEGPPRWELRFTGIEAPVHAWGYALGVGEHSGVGHLAGDHLVAVNFSPELRESTWNRLTARAGESSPRIQVNGAPFISRFTGRRVERLGLRFW